MVLSRWHFFLLPRDNYIFLFLFSIPFPPCVTREILFRLLSESKRFLLVCCFSNYSFLFVRLYFVLFFCFIRRVSYFTNRRSCRSYSHFHWGPRNRLGCSHPCLRPHLRRRSHRRRHVVSLGHRLLENFSCRPGRHHRS